MPYIHLFLNQHSGDSAQVVAIARQLTQAEHNVKTSEYQDNDPEIVNQLSSNLKSVAGDETHVLLISGSHGLDMLKNQALQAVLKKHNMVIAWGGHQDPGLTPFADSLQVVGLLKEACTPALHETFKEKLIETSMIPNTLDKSKVFFALNDWNTRHEKTPDAIPQWGHGYTGVFLGGDAPQANKSFLFYDADEAYEQGKAFGLEAARKNKMLLVTSGPRIGKFYENSPDLKNPVPRQFKGESWLDFSELTEQQKTNPTPDTLTHTANAPLDPVSKKFLRGIKDSYLPENQYRFIDFKFGKSAYQAMVGALYQAKDKSEAFYSADSISYAELGFYIPATYAFKIGSTNIYHQRTLKRLVEELHIVGEAQVIADGIHESVIDPIKNENTLTDGSNQDARKITQAIRAALQHLKPHHQAVAPIERPQRMKTTSERFSQSALRDRARGGTRHDLAHACQRQCSTTPSGAGRTAQW